MNQTSTTAVPACCGHPSPSRRGRPAIVHDNRRVQRFCRKFNSVFEMLEEFPELDDVLTGIAHLQSAAQGSTRSLSRRMLFRVLRECEDIAAANVGTALGRDYSRTAVGRYTLHARVASKFLARLLELHPDWECSAGTLRTDRDDLDRLAITEMGRGHDRPCSNLACGSEAPRRPN